jgi:hypothetical protein
VCMGLLIRANTELVLSCTEDLHCHVSIVVVKMQRMCVLG